MRCVVKLVDFQPLKPPGDEMSSSESVAGIPAFTQTGLSSSAPPSGAQTRILDVTQEPHQGRLAFFPGNLVGPDLLQAGSRFSLVQAGQLRSKALEDTPGIGARAPGVHWNPAPRLLQDPSIDLKIRQFSLLESPFTTSHPDVCVRQQVSMPTQNRHQPGIPNSEYRLAASDQSEQVSAMPFPDS